MEFVLIQRHIADCTDSYARDVTLRYTKNFGAKTAKLRPPPRKDEPDWWVSIMDFLRRPQRLVSDHSGQSLMTEPR
jgi:xeroderma pigmentosum group C-complementing protein